MEIPERERDKPDHLTTAKLIEQELKANDIISDSINEASLDAAMEISKHLEHSIIMQGTREILLMMKVKGVWVYRWVNMNCPATEFVEALRPIWDGAQRALTEEETNG